MRSILPLLFLITLALSTAGMCVSAPESSRVDSGSDESLVLRWKQKKVTVEEIEAATGFGLTIDRECAAWKKFKTQLHSGDEVWFFRSPGPTWEAKAGWQGYAIIRKEKLVDAYTTLEN
jgi:hypothetical protein